MISEPAAKQKAGSALESVGTFVEQYAGVMMGTLLVLFFVALVGLAANGYLWYDELVTLRVARLPHWHDIWNFYASGLDTIGLLYALLLHAVLKLPADAEISSRLPAIVAFLVTLECVFLFVRRRYAAVYAFAVVLLLMRYPFLDVAVFAKSYSFELAGAGFAMICWQAAMEGRSRGWNAVGVWCGLALAIYSHSFAIFLFVPFAGAQWWSDARRKRVDWPMWAALVLYPASLLPVLRGDLRASKLYGSNFWSRPSSALMKQTYIDYFLENWRYVLILVVASLIVWAVLGDRKVAERGPQRERTGFSAPEWLFVLLLTALPAYVLPASYLLHAYRDIYVVTFAIGLGILLVCSMAEQWRGSAAAGAVVMILFASVTLKVDLKTIPDGLRAMAHPERVHLGLQAIYDDEPWVKLLQGSDLPIVVGDHVLFTRMVSYGPPEMVHRLYFLTDFAQVNEYPKSETSQRNFLLFGKMLGYQTMDIGSFVPEHRHFLMAIKWTPETLHGTLWLEPYLIKQQEQGNAVLEFLGPEADLPHVFDVQFTRMPEFPEAPPLLR